MLTIALIIVVALMLAGSGWSLYGGASGPWAGGGIGFVLLVLLILYLVGYRI